jgi:two-component system, OmpR family, phosphate regulon sensor histidine kinase PhoR
VNPDNWAALALGVLLGGLGATWWLLRRQARLEALTRRALRAAGREVEQTRSQLALLAERLAWAERLVSEALVYVSPDGLVVGASPAAREWFELDVDERGQVPSAMAALRSAELAALVERVRAGEEEQPQRVRWAGRVLGARAGRLPGGGVILALRDETDLDRLARARRDLVANVSHDLRTPLTSMGLLVEALTAGGVDQPERARPLLDRIAEQLAVLNALVEGLLDLDRIETGHAVFQLRPVDLHGLLSEVTEGLRPQLDQGQVRVVAGLPAEAWVLADPAYAGRVLTNLLDNAVRFSPAGGQVRVTARPGDGDEAGHWVIAVADEGPGIPPGELDRIFERFYRADRARSGVASGLGLAIARHIVEGHGGTIRAANRPEGGAVFRFTLPAAEAPDPPAEAG